MKKGLDILFAITDGVVVIAALAMGLGLMMALIGWISMPDEKTLVFAVMLSCLAARLS